MSSSNNGRGGSVEEEAVTVYVLKLRNGCYYVGSTNDMQRRYNEHIRGEGSQWTRQHPPIEIREQVQGTRYHEDALVYQYMSLYGPDRVRGGTYSNLVLTFDQRATSDRQISHATQRCMFCHDNGHFVCDCPSIRQQRQHRGPQQCTRCGQNGHCDSTCFAATHINGGRLEFVASDDDDSSDDDDVASMCSRCGHSTHDSSNCYAQWDVNGHSLPGAPRRTTERQQHSRNRRRDEESNDSESDDSASNKSESGEESVCSRCGRDSHNSSSCYARFGIDGRPLGGYHG